MTVRDAFVHSDNAVFVSLLEEIRNIETARLLAEEEKNEGRQTFEELERHTFTRIHRRWRVNRRTRDRRE